MRLFKAEDIDKLKDFAKENNVEILGRNIFMPLWYTLSCTKYSKGNALEMANAFYESGIFRAAEPDLMCDNLIQCVNDDYFSDQWNLKNTGQYGGTNGIDIDICKAWELTRGCSHVVIAVVDHGIEMDHPDLPNMSALSYDTHSGTSPSQVLGPHGTACAGIAGADADNDEGIAGVAPESVLMSVSNSLVLNVNSRQQLADGINWAWNNGADIISNSWGHSALAGEFIDEAIDSALVWGREGLGCVVVFAAGNDNGAVIYPANSNPDIIAVGAMSPCGERKSPTSCDGEYKWGSNYGAQLDSVAPGVLISTTDLQGDGQYNSSVPIHIQAGGNIKKSDYSNRDYTVWFNGTSSATPHVAGVAALILSIDPGLTQDEVRDIIESTCTKVGNYNYSTLTGRYNGTWHQEVGYGCVNVYSALQAVYPYITGPTTVCSSGVFSINNLPSEPVVNWSIISGSNLASITVSNNEATLYKIHDGQITILASIETSCGDINLTKNIDLGAPLIEEVQFENCYGGVGEWCSSCTPNSFYTTPSFGDGYCQYRLKRMSGTILEQGYAYYGGDIIGYYTPNTYLFEVRAINECGSGEWFETEIEVVDCIDGGGGEFEMTVYPNPTSSLVSIELFKTNYNGTKNLISDCPEFNTSPIIIYIRDMFGKIAKIIKTKTSFITINIEDLKPGIYYVEAETARGSRTQQLIVEK